MRRALPGATVGDVLVVLLGILGGSSLSAALQGPGFWWAVALGAAVSAAVAAVAERLRLLSIEWVAVALAALLLLGGLAVSAVPTPSAYSTFLRGLVGGWVDLLTSVPPAQATGTLRVLPFVLTMAATTSGLLLLRRTRHPMLPAVGPIVVFGFGMLLTIESVWTARVHGLAVVAVALGLGWWRQRQSGTLIDAEIGNTTTVKKRGRLLYGGTLLAVVSVLGPALAPTLQSLHGSERVDLYRSFEPPWNPLDEPSPLAQIKSNYKDDVRDDVVFIARGGRVPRRWALATLASYADGVVWTVADSSFDGEHGFRPIDGVTAPDPLAPASERATVEVDVEIVGDHVDWPWLPLPGRAQRIDAFDEEGNRLDVRFFDATGTAAIPSGSRGQRYVVSTLPFQEIPITASVELRIPDETNLGLERQAEAVLTASATLVEGATSGWPQIRALADNLRSGTYLASDEARPGHSQGRLARFLENSPLVGNEEQYAAFAAIAARNTTQSPVRVVVGWLADEEKDLTGSVEFTRNEATAWIEVLTEQFGWVAVDVTPDRTNEPDLNTPGTNYVDVAAPNPPVPPPPPPELETDQEEREAEEDDEEEPPSRGVPTWVVAAGTATIAPVALIGGWLLVMVVLKRRRRSQRRSRPESHQRIEGAWFEARDRLSEAGLRSPSDLSVHEMAVGIDTHFDNSSGLTELARIVDASAFGPERGSPDEATEAWQHVETIQTALSATAARRERLRRTANPTPLFRRDPRVADEKGVDL